MNNLLRELRWDLRGNKVNSLLSLLALFVATFAYVVISAFSSIGQDALVAKTEQLSGRAVTLGSTLSGAGWTSNRVRTLEAGISAWPGNVAQGSLVLDKSVSLLNRSSEVSAATLRLVSPGYDLIRRVTLTRGRWYSNSVYPGEVTINLAAAALLSSGAGSLRLQLPGQVTLNENVVGVIADGEPQPVIYADVLSVMLTAPVYGGPDSASLLSHTDNSHYETAVTLTTQALADVGFLGAPRAERLDQTGQIKASISVLAYAFRGVTLIALLVAILGMINVGLASVRERSRDFTVRRALGSRRSRVFVNVTLATLVIGATASAAAVACSFAVVTVVAPHFVDPDSGVTVPTYPWGVAATAALIGLSASLLSGLVPALRTYSLDLASILRE